MASAQAFDRIAVLYAIAYTKVRGSSDDVQPVDARYRAHDARLVGRHLVEPHRRRPA